MKNRIFATPATPVDYYNETRTYLSLNKTISRVAETAGRILCGPILGGLHQKTRRVERSRMAGLPVFAVVSQSPRSSRKHSKQGMIVQAALAEFVQF